MAGIATGAVIGSAFDSKKKKNIEEANQLGSSNVLDDNRAKRQLQKEISLSKR